jgi:sugar phosphate isomerase/epimerase
MKLSCLPVSFFADIIAGRMTVGEWARLGAETGLDGVDLSILFLPERTLEAAREVRRQVEAEGMRVVMITTYPDFTHPDAGQRQLELEQECQAVSLAAELGAGLIRVTAGQAHPETGLGDGICWAAEGLQRLAERAGDQGVGLVYENHAKPGIWQYTDFCQPPQVFLEILSRVDCPKLGVNFDVGNAATYASDPLAMLEQVLPRIVSIHASDSSERGQLKHTLLGTGVTPYPKMFRRLKQAGWDGWICMEEGSFRGREGVALAAEFIRCTWENA